MRTLALLVLAAGLASSCIVYEKRTTTITVPCDDCTTIPEVTDPAVVVDPSLYLSVNQASPGDRIITTLESTQPRSFQDILNVTFERDIRLLDLELESDEAVLLIEVAPNARLGQIQVGVVGTNDEAWLLQDAFAIVEPAPIDPPSTGDTANGDTGTTATGDTGSAP